MITPSYSHHCDSVIRYDYAGFKHEYGDRAEALWEKAGTLGQVGLFMDEKNIATKVECTLYNGPGGVVGGTLVTLVTEGAGEGHTGPGGSPCCRLDGRFCTLMHCTV